MSWAEAAGLAAFFVALLSPLLINFLNLLAAPNGSVFVATLVGLPALNWLLANAMFAGADGPGGMGILLVAPAAAAGWVFGALAWTSIARRHDWRPLTPIASLVLYVVSAALLLFYPGPSAIWQIVQKAGEWHSIQLVAAIAAGFMSMQFVPSRRAAFVAAAVAIFLTAIAWIFILNAALRLDELYLAGLTVILNEVSYGIVTGAMVRWAAPDASAFGGRLQRAIVAFVPLALIGIALFAGLNDNL